MTKTDTFAQAFDDIEAALDGIFGVDYDNRSDMLDMVGGLLTRVKERLEGSSKDEQYYTKKVTLWLIEMARARAVQLKDNKRSDTDPIVMKALDNAYEKVCEHRIDGKTVVDSFDRDLLDLALNEPDHDQIDAEETGPSFQIV